MAGAQKSHLEPEFARDHLSKARLALWTHIAAATEATEREKGNPIRFRTASMRHLIPLIFVILGLSLVDCLFEVELSGVRVSCRARLARKSKRPKAPRAVLMVCLVLRRCFIQQLTRAGKQLALLGKRRLVDFPFAAYAMPGHAWPFSGCPFCVLLLMETMLRRRMDMALANFGVPKYGAQLV